MSDYQAIYDAVRSRISYCDVGRSVEEAARNAFDVSHIVNILYQEFSLAAYGMARPSVLYRPRLLLDGTKWCALYGDDLMNGVSGHGDTPEAAMADFDRQWATAKTPAAVLAEVAAA